MGGLNILNPTDKNEHNYSASRKLTETITETLKKKTLFDPDQYMSDYFSAQEEIIKAKNQVLEETLNNTLKKLDQLQQRAILRAKDKKKWSTWLMVLPIAQHHFDLSPQEFRDTVYLL